MSTNHNIDTKQQRLPGEQTMSTSEKSIKISHHKTVLTAVLLIFLMTPLCALAAEEITSDAYTAKYQEITLQKAEFTGVEEDAGIIDGEKYIFSKYTKVYQGLNEWTRYEIPLANLSLPRRVTITYRVYEISTESEPFSPDDKVLVSISVPDFE
ncbi:MAG: hypothetical protein HKM93_02145 [Desulfobacteraceae bacterium]|nr:hypothetical protein [Desulfobacteraceae bacterium]